MSEGKRSRFVSDAVSTASPGRLLVMLYDRLVLDLSRAERALESDDAAGADAALRHAQDIVFELVATLDVEAWDGAPALLAIYQFILGELVQANVAASAQQVLACRRLVEPLRDAWAEAVELAAGGSAAATPVPAGSVTGYRVG